MKNKLSPVIIVFGIVVTASLLFTVSVLPMCIGTIRPSSFMGSISTTISEVSALVALSKSGVGLGDSGGQLLLSAFIGIIYLIINVIGIIVIFVNLIRLFVSFKNAETRDMKIFGYVGTNISFPLVLTALALTANTGHGFGYIGPGGFAAIGCGIAYMVILFIYNLSRKAVKQIKKLNVISFIANGIFLLIIPVVVVIYSIMTDALFQSKGYVSAISDAFYSFKNPELLFMFGGLLIIMTFFISVTAMTSSISGFGTLSFPPSEKDYKRNLKKGVSPSAAVAPPAGLYIFLFVLYLIGFVLTVVSGKAGAGLILEIVLLLVYAVLMIAAIIIKNLVKKAAAPIDMKTTIQFYNDITVDYIPQSAVVGASDVPAPSHETDAASESKIE